MNTIISQPVETIATQWLDSMVNSVSGLTIKVKSSVFSGSSPFQKIEVFDTYRFGLVLCLGGCIVFTERDEAIYHEMMVHPALLMHGNPKRVCIIGGGDGGCLREVLKYPSVEKVHVVDIDRMVTDTIDRHFPDLACGLKNKRVTLTFKDGCDFLEQSSDQYDVILVDSYAPGGLVATLETTAFYHELSHHCTPGGIAVIQTDSPTLKPSMLRKTMADVTPEFAEVKPYLCSLPSFPEGLCSFVVCAKEKEGLNGFNQKSFEAIASDCVYYNSDVHTGAFLLPQCVKRELI